MNAVILQKDNELRNLRSKPKETVKILDNSEIEKLHSQLKLKENEIASLKSQIASHVCKTDLVHHHPSSIVHSNAHNTVEQHHHQIASQSGTNEVVHHHPTSIVHSQAQNIVEQHHHHPTSVVHTHTQATIEQQNAGTSHRRVSSQGGVFRASSQDKIQTVRNPGQTSKNTVIHSHVQNPPGTNIHKGTSHMEKPTEHQTTKQKATTKSSPQVQQNVVQHSTASSGVQHEHTTNLVSDPHLHHVVRDVAHVQDLPIQDSHLQQSKQSEIQSHQPTNLPQSNLDRRTQQFSTNEQQDPNSVRQAPRKFVKSESPGQFMVSMNAHANHVSEEPQRYPSNTKKGQTYNMGDLQGRVDSSIQNNITRNINLPTTNQGSSLQSNTRVVRKADDSENQSQQQSSQQKVRTETGKKVTTISARSMDKSDSKVSSKARIPVDSEKNKILQNIQLSPDRIQQRPQAHESPEQRQREQTSYSKPSNQKRQSISEDLGQNSPQTDSNIKISYNNQIPTGQSQPQVTVKLNQTVDLDSNKKKEYLNELERLNEIITNLNNELISTKSQYQALKNHSGSSVKYIRDDDEINTLRKELSQLNREISNLNVEAANREKAFKIMNEMQSSDPSKNS